jgi:hypothetical protein
MTCTMTNEPWGTSESSDRFRRRCDVGDDFGRLFTFFFVGVGVRSTLFFVVSTFLLTFGHLRANAFALVTSVQNDLAGVAKLTF